MKGCFFFFLCVMLAALAVSANEYTAVTLSRGTTASAGLSDINYADIYAITPDYGSDSIVVHLTRTSSFQTTKAGYILCLLSTRTYNPYSTCITVAQINDYWTNNNTLEIPIGDYSTRYIGVSAAQGSTETFDYDITYCSQSGCPYECGGAECSNHGGCAGYIDYDGPENGVCVCDWWYFGRTCSFNFDPNQFPGWVWLVVIVAICCVILLPIVCCILCCVCCVCIAGASSSRSSARNGQRRLEGGLYATGTTVQYQQIPPAVGYNTQPLCVPPCPPPPYPSPPTNVAVAAPTFVPATVPAPAPVPAPVQAAAATTTTAETPSINSSFNTKETTPLLGNHTAPTN